MKLPKQKMGVLSLRQNREILPGTVYGGLAATMLDSCMGRAIHSTLPKSTGSTTLGFKVSFVRPIAPATGLIFDT